MTLISGSMLQLGKGRNRRLGGGIQSKMVAMGMFKNQKVLGVCEAFLWKCLLFCRFPNSCFLQFSICFKIVLKKLSY